MTRKTSFFTGIICVLVFLGLLCLSKNYFCKQDPAGGHPFPAEEYEYILYKQDPNRPVMRIYTSLWTDGEYKDLHIIFEDSNGEWWSFTTQQPHSPDHWLTKHIVDKKTGEGEYLNMDLVQGGMKQ